MLGSCSSAEAGRDFGGLARQVLQGRGKEFTGKVEPSVSNNG